MWITKSIVCRFIALKPMKNDGFFTEYKQRTIGMDSFYRFAYSLNKAKSKASEASPLVCGGFYLYIASYSVGLEDVEILIIFLVLCGEDESACTVRINRTVEEMIVLLWAVRENQT